MKRPGNSSQLNKSSPKQYTNNHELLNDQEDNGFLDETVRIRLYISLPAILYISSRFHRRDRQRPNQLVTTSRFTPI